jgi:hypothetical protein
MRGSSPLAFPDGRVRRRTAAEVSKINAIIDSRIAMWIAKTTSTDFVFINWIRPANCAVAAKNPQPNKGKRINASYMGLFLEIFVLAVDNDDGRSAEFYDQGKEARITE